MEDTTNDRIKNEIIRVAVIFLLTGLLLGSGLTLCVIDFTFINAVTIKTFGSLVVIGSIFAGIEAAITLVRACYYFLLLKKLPENGVTNS